MKNLLRFIIAIFIPASVFAGSPLFTLSPLTPTAIQLASLGTATVHYVVQNQSNKTHTMMMRPIIGVTQITTAGNCPNPFVLGAKQSCTLTLLINGNQLSSNLSGGPVICQQGSNDQPNPLFCYQPSFANSLNITLTPVSAAFYSGGQNGNVYYSFTGGSAWAATAVMPGGGSPVNGVFAINNTLYAGAANGFVYYSTNNGTTWNATRQPDGSAVNCIFVMNNTLYAGTADGSIFYSTNNGNSWSAQNQPDGSAVTAIFVATNALYAGTANGNVYYSINNGITWTPINGQPDGSSIKSIFVANSTLYVNTATEYAFASSSLTGGGTWSAFAQSAYSLFVNASNNTIYAGSQSGYVYSLTYGTEVGFIDYTPINSIYVLNVG